MMRPFFISFALLVSAVLSGCGFTPMHGTAGSTAPLANMNIEMDKSSDVVNNQAGFFVTQRLRDRLGNGSQAARYTLKITPTYRRTRLGLTSGDVASRYDVTVTAKWKLVDAKTGKTAKTGRALSVVTFGAPAGPYGVITADNVGVEQSAKEAADKLIVQLARHFADDAKKAEK